VARAAAATKHRDAPACAAFAPESALTASLRGSAEPEGSRKRSAGSYVRTHVRAIMCPMTANNDVSAWAAVLRTHAAILPKLERALTKTGLPLTWYDVLLVVNAAPDRKLRMSELGRQAVVSRERVSRVVSELEREGLMERRPNPDDKRSSFAAITPEGRRRLKAAAPTYLNAVAQHFLAHLTPEELQLIATSLSRVVEAEER
jgi:DNA-binding MarR family transcriptional regulator